MAKEVKTGSAYIEIRARKDKLKKDIDDARSFIKKEAKQIEESFSKLKLRFENSLMKMKLNEVEKLHRRLKAELQKKIKMNADIASIERTKLKLRSVENALSGIKKEAVLTQSKTTGFFKGMNAQITAVIAALYALKRAWDFASEAKNAARNAEETRSKFDTVFESLKEQANNLADNFAENFGVAGTTARELLGNTGDLLVGFGFTEKKALDLSLRVNELAQDLASFTNYSGGAKGASEALTKAILGETESAKSLGIVIRQNTPEFKREIQRLITTRGLTEQQAKAVLILNEAYKQSGKAVGDYARTKDSLANTERRMNEQYKELLEIIGNELNPTFKVLINYISTLTAKMSENSSIFNVLGAVARVLGTDLLLVATVLQHIWTLIGMVGKGMYNLLTMQFEEAANSIKSGVADIASNFELLWKNVKEIWSNAEKKKQEFAKSGGISPGSQSDITADQKVADKRAKIIAKFYNDLKFLSKNYYSYKLQQIEAEAEAMRKAAGDAVDVEKWKLEQIKQLNEDMLAVFVSCKKWEIFYKPRTKITKEDTDTLAKWKKEREDELKQKELDFVKVKGEKTLEYIDASLEKERQMNYENLQAAMELSSVISSAFDQSGDSLLSKFNIMVQMALRIATILNSANALNTAAGPLGIISAIIGGVSAISSKGHTGGVFENGKKVASFANVPRLSSGGSFTVPVGYPQDTYPLLVETGEKVSVTPATSAGNTDKLLKNILTAIQAQTINSIENKPIVTIVNKIDGSEFTSKVVQPNINRLNKAGVNLNEL